MCVVLRARVVGLRFVLAGRLCKYAGSRAHTWCAHTLLCGHVPCVRLGACLLRLVVGVFARWVVGLGVCATARVRVGVCAFGVGALVGWWDSSVSPPRLFACLALTSWRGLLWRVRAGSARRAGRLYGRDNHVPPIQRGAVPVAWRGGEKREGWCARGVVNIRTHRERGDTGRALVGLAGGGVWVGACVLVRTIPVLLTWGR